MTPPRASSIAKFPACPECKRPIIAPTSDAPICFRLKGGEPQTLPRGQKAQLLRFLWSERPNRVVGDQMYLALERCLQVSRVIDGLRHKHHIPVPCDDIAKLTRSGTYGSYWLGEGVEVWELDSDAPALAGEA